MKKKVCLTLAVIMTIGMSSIAFANDVVTGSSLEDVINGTVTQQTQVQTQEVQQQPVQTQVVQQQTQQQVQTQQQPVQTQVQEQGTLQQVQGQMQEMRGEPNNFFGTLSEITDMSDYEDETVKKAGSTLSRWVGMLCQFIGYVLCAGIVARAVLDLTYIALPFCRGILGRGIGGNTGANNAMGTPGMNSMNRVGGYNSGGTWGGVNTMNTMSPVGGMNSQPSNSSHAGFDLISNTARNAVQQEGQMDQATGRKVSPFKIYVKDMAVVLILAPALFVLAISGALTNIGFMAGEIVGNLLSNFSAF